jgi:hypothetical protein
MSGAAVADDPLPTYEPMFADAPPSRVGSTKRGAYGYADIIVFAPVSTGATAQTSPVLFWYQSAPTTNIVEFVIQVLNADEPLHEVQMNRALSAGLNALSLDELGISLRSGIEYEWSIALVIDPERRSQDIFSMGSIRFIEPDKTLTRALAGRSTTDQARRLLEVGYWYDALELMNEQSGSAEDTATLTAWRESLLTNQGLLASLPASVE